MPRPPNFMGKAKPFSEDLYDSTRHTVCICPEERLVDELPREAFDMPVCLVLS